MKHTCHAVYVGLYMQGSHRTEVQWESKKQAGSGNGQVARLRRSHSGVVVTNCHIAGYAHG